MQRQRVRCHQSADNWRVELIDHDGRRLHAGLFLRCAVWCSDDDIAARSIIRRVQYLTLTIHIGDIVHQQGHATRPRNTGVPITIISPAVTVDCQLPDCPAGPLKATIYSPFACPDCTGNEAPASAAIVLARVQQPFLFHACPIKLSAVRQSNSESPGWVRWLNSSDASQQSRYPGSPVHRPQSWNKGSRRSASRGSDHLCQRATNL